MNRKPLLITVAVICLVAAGWMALRAAAPSPERSGPQATWYYVIDSGDLAVADYAPSPVRLADGREAVRAFVFGCGGCEADRRSIGYLESFTPEARQALEAGPPEEDRAAYDRKVAQGRLVAAVPEVGQPIQWHPAQSPDAAAILAGDPQACRSAERRACYP